ncbi:hypothetical protein V497_06061, partial [Pseudogymnoascus sp. VKM F-4516 (FW-969)]
MSHPSSSPPSTATMPTPSAAPSNVDLTHFLSLPWCAALLSAPHTTLLPTPSRTPKSSTEDSLFAITLHTGDTLRYMISFSSPRSGTTDTGAGAAAELPPTAPGSKEGGLENEVVSTLFSMGDGMNGYPAVAHGGLIAALFDEAMGVAMMRLRASAADLKNPAGMADIVTASLKVDF